MISMKNINKTIEPSGFSSPKLEGRMVEGKGRAVFASEKILKGEVLSVWGGAILSLVEIKSMGWDGARKSVQVEDNFVTYSTVEGVCDWYNHSCEPNAGFRGQITLVAMREIQKGEEITFDYAFCDSSDYDEFDCACGSKSCRKSVTGDAWKNSDLQNKYFDYFSSYLQEKIRKLRGKP